MNILITLGWIAIAIFVYFLYLLVCDPQALNDIIDLFRKN